MGNDTYVWLLLVQVFIGILIAFLQKNGATHGFVQVVGKKLTTRVHVQLFAWFLGIVIFFSDYFTPLFVGPVMRDLIDKAKVSREKLAYICDSTSAPKCVLIPFSEWGVFIVGLLVGIGPMTDKTIAMTVFIKSIPFNFYAIAAIGMVGLIGAGLIPDFGPMRKAEKRVREQGKLFPDGSTPMMSKELSNITKAGQIIKPRVFINFILPMIVVIAYPLWTYIDTKDAKILEGFMMTVMVLGLGLWYQKVPLKEIVDTAIQGIKGIMPAIIILTLAMTINKISEDLGTAQFVVKSTQSWLRPALLPALTFGVGAFISFSTGTSWGTYAIVLPLATIAAIAGGGVFGDHCSPLSDTTILSSLGAGSDHIDHVKTQLPYAFLAAVLTLVIYLIIGVF